MTDTTNTSGAGLERIRSALAAGPTDGLWQWCIYGQNTSISTVAHVADLAIGPENGNDYTEHSGCGTDAEWIAACNPVAIRALLGAHDDAAALLLEREERIARLEEAIRQADSVLRVIEEQDPIENCLDPQWAGRIAKSARAALSTSHPKG